MNSDATFIIMYRVQSAVATLSAMSSLGAFGFDVWLLIREEMYWINTFYEHIDEYADILLVWAVELLMLVMTCVLSGKAYPSKTRSNTHYDLYSAVCICRLGCCCCGCPNMTPDGSNKGSITQTVAKLFTVVSC